MAIINIFGRKITKPILNEVLNDSKHSSIQSIPAEPGIENRDNGTAGNINREPVGDGLGAADKNTAEAVAGEVTKERGFVPGESGVLPESASTSLGNENTGSVSPDGSRVHGNDGSAAVDAALPAGSTADLSVDQSTQATIQSVRPISVSKLSSLANKRINENLDALELLKHLDDSGVSSRDAQLLQTQHATLKAYSGWGGLTQVFNEADVDLDGVRELLKSYLSEEEYASARASILNAYFTNDLVISTIHGALKALGVDGAIGKTRYLEPSAGTGLFIDNQPSLDAKSAQWVGVELDKTTARIAKFLNPDAKILNQGFEEIDYPDGYFDVVVGNPPYGQERIYDKNNDAPYSGASVHNYFICKSISQLRPGGLLAMVVTRRFMDGLNDAKDDPGQKWLKENADLVSAVRLPGAVFSHTGTDVVSDIVILQRKTLDLSSENNHVVKQNAKLWTKSTEKTMYKDGSEFSFPINLYLSQNPGNILGIEQVGSNQFGPSYDVRLSPQQSLNDKLSQWVSKLPSGFYKDISVNRPKDADSKSDIPEYVPVGNYYVDSANQVFQRMADSMGEKTMHPWTASNGKAHLRMIGMIGVREALSELMNMEIKFPSTSLSDQASLDLDVARANLNKKFDEFHKDFGFFNDTVNRNVFFEDSKAQLLYSLETNYEKAITPARAEKLNVPASPAKAGRASILDNRVLFKPEPLPAPTNPKDALLWSLSKWGSVRMDEMTEVLHMQKNDVIKELEGMIFRNPMNFNDFILGDIYLSGDVKTKLEQAQEIVNNAPMMGFENNIDKLKEVIPVDRLPSQIHAPIGASWIPPNVYRDFSKVITGTTTKWSYLPSMGAWIEGDSNFYETDSSLMRGKYGTAKLSSREIFERLMTLKSVEVKMKRFVDGKEVYVTDEGATEVARIKADDITELWGNWLWNEPDRATKLATIYNEKFNRSVDRVYDGSHISLSDASPSITFLKHQQNAVWRCMVEDSLLLDHSVGAGKTFCMAASAMEMKRIGRARKPMIAVPNHLTMEWRAAFTQLYPGANILAATPEDFEAERRKKLFSRIALGNWDAVIVGHSSLQRMEIGDNFMENFLKEQINEIITEIDLLKSGKSKQSNDVRQLERTRLSLKAKFDKIKNRSAKKDDILTFDQLGIDALFIDECHEFKNLMFQTKMQRVSGLGNPEGSAKALDLFAKIRFLQQRGMELQGAPCPIIGATGTPVSNSLAEMYTMQRLMQYDKLKEDNLHVFDAWARQYAQIETLYEVAPSGVGYRTAQRLSKFKNLPQLMGSYKAFADVLTLNDLKQQELDLGRKFPVPKIAGGKPTNVVAHRSPLQEKFFGIPMLSFEKDEIAFEIDPKKQWIIERNHDDTLDLEKMWVLKANGFDGVDQSQQRITSYGYSSCHASEEDAQEELLTNISTPKIVYDSDSLLGQFSNLRELTKSTNGKINALSLTSLANKCGLDYRIIDPTAPDFKDSKINKAIESIATIHKEWEVDRGTQLVFCDMSVPISEHARSASKSKLCLVRDEDDQITALKGTLNTIEGHELYPFFIVKSVGAATEPAPSDAPVADGKKVPKKAKGATQYTAYDPISGIKVCQSAHADELKVNISKIFESPKGLALWTDIQNSQPSITQDLMDDHLIANDLFNPESTDHYFSMLDIQALASNAQFSVYEDMRDKLIARGIKANEIAFIHDYDTPLAKSLLFHKVNKGEVRILFGSTPKLGAGTNVQERLVASHNIDAPWRPSDLEQRDGRIIRRGNMFYERDPENFSVGLFRYATEQTYDTRRWQLLEHKSMGVEQLRKWRNGVDAPSEIEDIVGEAANAAEMKSCASGNPLVLLETKLANEVKRLKSVVANEKDTRYQDVKNISNATQRIEGCDENIVALKEILTKVQNKLKEDKPVLFKGHGEFVVDDIRERMKVQVIKLEELQKKLDAASANGSGNENQLSLIDQMQSLLSAESVEREACTQVHKEQPLEKAEKLKKVKAPVEPTSHAKMVKLMDRMIDYVNYQGVPMSFTYDDFEFKLIKDQMSKTFYLQLPDESKILVASTSSGIIQRVRNYLDPGYIESSLNSCEKLKAESIKTLSDSKVNLASPESNMKELLSKAMVRHKDVKRSLMKTSVLTLLSDSSKSLLKTAQTRNIMTLRDYSEHIDWDAIEERINSISKTADELSAETFLTKKKSVEMSL